MSYLGVDVGSGSVRCMLTAGNYRATESRQISINHSPGNRAVVTQSSREIFQAIQECFQHLLKLSPVKGIDGISVTATCSMVVREVLEEAGTNMVLGPYNGDQDIIMWMDCRSSGECEKLNTLVPQDKLSIVGGRYIPEMGLPKLKWLSDHTDKQLMCFELYDWISHLLIVGVGETVPYNHSYGIDDVAMDGSIKGWSEEFLSSVDIRNGIRVGGYGLDRSRVMPLGSAIGTMAATLTSSLGIAGQPTIYHGCIDCYAGWVSTNPDILDRKVDGTLSMIAGTSTCFVLPTSSSEAEPIDGIWGPFWQLLPNKRVYSFGQPATGKLFEDLFREYNDIIGDHNGFEVVERETRKLELEHHQTINSLIRCYFYYGDVYGNRSPYNDFSMSEAYIDGANSSVLQASVLRDHTATSLVVRYNLILEFLAFQTKQIIGNVQNESIDHVEVSGSQAANARFMQLLSTVLQVSVVSTPASSQYQVVEGSCLIAMWGHRSQKDGGRLKEIREPRSKKIYEPAEGANSELLRTKCKLVAQLSQLQRTFRQQMVSFPQCTTDKSE
ncbi:Protein MPA43 [Meyerozyma sp. JA9]|nr:Protein MPA43 [Meyerozyma sp. JA9]